MSPDSKWREIKNGMPDETPRRGKLKTLERALERFLRPLPRFLYIESTNACNLKCRMCPTGRGDLSSPKGLMKPEILRDVLDGAKGCEPAETIFLHKDGEPLLNPDIFEMVKIAKSSGVAKEIAFATNATLLDSGASKELIAAGLDELYVSIESLDPERYAEIRAGADLETVLENIGRFIELKGGKGRGPRLVITTINMGCSAPDVIGIFDRWRDVADRVQVVERYGWAGRYNEELPVKRSRREHPCAGLWYLMVVTWRGEVNLCCLDAGSTFPVADVSDESIPGIWRGENYRRLRRIHLEGKFDEITICRNCIDGDIPWIEKTLSEIPGS